jgi:hypothetical protein
LTLFNQSNEINHRYRTASTPSASRRRTSSLPHIHLRLPESCVSHSINLCVHHTIKTAEHHVVLLPAGTEAGDIFNIGFGPYPWRLEAAKWVEEEKMAVQ